MSASVVAELLKVPSLSVQTCRSQGRCHLQGVKKGTGRKVKSQDVQNKSTHPNGNSLTLSSVAKTQLVKKKSAETFFLWLKNLVIQVNHRTRTQNLGWNPNWPLGGLCGGAVNRFILAKIIPKMFDLSQILLNGPHLHALMHVTSAQGWEKKQVTSWSKGIVDRQAHTQTKVLSLWGPSHLTLKQIFKGRRTRQNALTPQKCPILQMKSIFCVDNSCNTAVRQEFFYNSWGPGSLIPFSALSTPTPSDA